jgi:hypothetical protein
MNRAAAVLIVVAVLAGPVLAAGPSGKVVLKESAVGFGAGTGVAAIGVLLYGCGSFVNWAWGGGQDWQTAGTAALAVAPAVCGVGTSLVGRHYREGGSMLASIGGSYLGAAVGGVLFWYTANLHGSGTVRNLHYPAAVLAPFVMTAGGIVGYNLTRSKDNARGSLEDRFGMPAFGFCPAETRSGDTELAVNVKLLDFRF